MNKPDLPPRGPVAPRRPSQSHHHGIDREDDYAWLRADNWQAVMRDPAVLPPDIRAHLEAENAYTAAAMGDTEALQETLFAEMKGRIKEDDSSVPAPDGPFDYYTRYITGGQQPLFCRRPRGGGEETILIDGNALAEGHAYFRISQVAHSPDHKRIAYAVDTKGSEYFTAKVIDAETGAVVEEAVTDACGGLEWAMDSQTLLYVWLDEEHRPRKLFAHKIGDKAEHRLIHNQTDPGLFLDISLTQDGKYLLLGTHDHETTEVSLIDAADPYAKPRLVAPRQAEHEYSVCHHEGRLIILTNSDSAEDFRIVEAPADDPSPANWTEIEPHRPGRLILDIIAFKDFLVRLERENGLPRIVIRRFADGEEHEIAFDEEAYALGMSAGYEYDTTTLRFTYSSMTTPSQVYDYDMATRERTLRKTQEIPSGHDPSQYVTRRVFAPAKDGETVPVTLLYRKDTKLDGTAPLLLYGYGSYGITIPASFSTNALSLVDRGFVYAIAHVRGGKDKGFAWYKNGKRAKKTNTFTDFIAAGEYLAKEKFTSRGRIVAQGGSAGGMLMGAIANMAPDLFLGIIAEVPFVDVLTTMLDASLPLTPPEWPEWGNPIESAEDYKTIAAYSPYDNVRAQGYPNILALAGLTDPRVTYWEPAKWIARLRETGTGNNLILLKTNMEAGHAGASGRFDRLKEVALSYAFALKLADRA
ncbi:S9 family peptidase [Methyloceanibacter caenitepidi]|uniref:Protease II n=1 Tax=Methyloceanibacter caenitepidi TaxID=1384459 RepID=A0A0A8K7Q0_9HYPH|nr:S9 family peptidase [Methyloceanibacter caenitepidi]BAQ18029.1 protease II [Methyloceanibacter caenitepidi]